MDDVILGRTGLRVSRAGLGCGGHSRLGLSGGRTDAEAESVVREALALGINFIDTAEGYGTEEVVGRAIGGTPRDRVVLSTKAGVQWKDRKATGAEMKERIEACLGRLRTDHVDVFHLHGVSADDYPYAREELIPALRELQAAGKIRFLGITEAFASDTSHRMLSLAVQDDCWDVMMVGFNMLNPSARETILARTRERNIGTLCMFAVRRALSRPDALRNVMRDLASEGRVDPEAFDPENPLGFLMEDGISSSLPEAAYRFCRWEPGIDVVLTGTGSAEHLKANIASIAGAPLPPAVVERLTTLFAKVDTVSGN